MFRKNLAHLAHLAQSPYLCGLKRARLLKQTAPTRAHPRPKRLRGTFCRTKMTNGKQTHLNLEFFLPLVKMIYPNGTIAQTNAFKV